jgi:hypothetical protein
MTPHRPSQIRSQRRLAVAWRDSVWFPPVLAEGRYRAEHPRRPVVWPTQIITDPTTCAARTLNLTQP